MLQLKFFSPLSTLGESFKENQCLDGDGEPCSPDASFLTKRLLGTIVEFAGLNFNPEDYRQQQPAIPAPLRVLDSGLSLGKGRQSINQLMGRPRRSPLQPWESSPARDNPLYEDQSSDGSEPPTLARHWSPSPRRSLPEIAAAQACLERGASGASEAAASDAGASDSEAGTITPRSGVIVSRQPDLEGWRDGMHDEVLAITERLENTKGRDRRHSPSPRRRPSDAGDKILAVQPSQGPNSARRSTASNAESVGAGVPIVVTRRSSQATPAVQSGSSQRISPRSDAPHRTRHVPAVASIRLFSVSPGGKR
ncbi:hypothetical protein WJX73_007568 [Symbiochloris irregularis]|uniref:Uncharacterized protein n=1 Tax=Symbiochloris irregularis TaxID=706552 RepID=A0AAW1PRT6_9CHLO